MTEKKLSRRSAARVGRFCWKGTKRFFLTVTLLILLYALFVLIGLIPVNNGFRPADDGVEIYVVSNPVHADLVLPIANEAMNWREQFPADCFQGNTNYATHIAVGWGDKGFFIETPTWADLRASTAVNALFLPSDTCMHVSLTTEKYLGENARKVVISKEQYQALIQFIETSFQKSSSGERIQIPDTAYGKSDAFFEAEGTYFCTNTCNSWIGQGMRSAEIRTPMFTPLPKTVFLYLPETD